MFPIFLVKKTLRSVDQLEFTESSFTAKAWVKIDDFSTTDLPIFGTDEKSADKGLHLIVRNQKPYLSFYDNDTTYQNWFFR